MFDFALSIFLLLSPIIFMPLNGYSARFQWYQFGYFSGSISLLQLQFFQYGTVFLFLAGLLSKPIRSLRMRWLGFLFFFCLLGVFNHPKTIQNFHNLLLGFLLYYLVVTYTKNVKAILKVVVIVAALNTVFSILQFFNIQVAHFPKPAINQPTIIGLMSYKSQLGIYQALALPICYAFNPYLSIIPLIGLLLSKSVTAIIPAIIGMVWLFRKQISRLQFSYMYFMAFITFVVVLGTKFIPQFNLRLDVWRETLKLIAIKPIQGYGIGIFNYINKKYVGYTDPYSIYLEVAYSLGIIGLIVLVAFIANRLKGFKNTTVTAQGLFVSCLILSLCGFGYSFMDYPRLAGTAIVLFGLLTVVKGEKLCL